MRRAEPGVLSTCWEMVAVADAVRDLRPDVAARRAPGCGSTSAVRGKRCSRAAAQVFPVLVR
ncbi:hypothetical protein LO762_29195 [Actinocorallia sp. API 0066]|uniref:hypothetical protein n=1 Tax=Actinocorallia sp. API 0066 TaxID=2896846 RepID=UPI001E3F1DBA|nr:hypothetical protein [Actinocorallia sp. API 0066]MCD0453228.1 hypothetical protein [Actinocorallia sp. API 0066]